MARVTVVNNSAGSAGKSLVVVLSRVDVPGGSVLTFPHAPNEVTIVPAPSWKDRRAAGAVASSQDWTGNASEKVSVSTRQSVPAGASPNRLETLINGLRAWSKKPTDLTQAPSRVAMSWGDYYYTGVLSNLSIKKEVVDDRGNALVASISFTLLESI